MTASQVIVASPPRWLWRCDSHHRVALFYKRPSTLVRLFSIDRLVIILLLYYDYGSACYSCLGLSRLRRFMR